MSRWKGKVIEVEWVPNEDLFRVSLERLVYRPRAGAEVVELIEVDIPRGALDTLLDKDPPRPLTIAEMANNPYGSFDRMVEELSPEPKPAKVEE